MTKIERDAPSGSLIQKETVSVSGQHIELAFTRREGSLPVLVMLHGLGCSQRSFAGVFQAAAVEGRAILKFDLPGFGDSALPEMFQCSLENHAAAAAALLDNLGIKDLHLLGHSMGGAIALLMAPSLGKRLKSLTSVEGNLVGSDCGVSRFVCNMSRDRFENEFFARLKKRTPPLERAFTALELSRPRAFYESSCSQVRWSDSETLLTTMLELNAPRLYIHGRRSKDLGALHRLEGVDKASIPESGHFPMNENPNVFYATWGNWLDAIT